MKTKHTPEPWALHTLFESPMHITYENGQEGYHNTTWVIDNERRIIAELGYSTDFQGMGWGKNETIIKWKANAARIVACVNACAGMEDPAAEIAALRERIAELEAKVPTKPEPNWDEAPEWANWWAVDEDGSAWWYILKPSLDESEWFTERVDSNFAGRANLNGYDWKQTLTQRP